MSALVYLLPVMAFGALILPPGRRRSGGSLRLVAAAAALALFLVLLSTGINNPGAPLFNVLYHLPYGWLLREPGRFLMLGGLAYGVLLACGLDALWSLPRPQLVPRLQAWRLAIPAAAVLVILAMVPAYPLATGALVNQPREATPDTHVVQPAYWTEMAAYINALPGDGRVVVMPPDDFYQMPYRWGFYGSDEFIQQATGRGVLVPNGDGYSPGTAQLRGAVATVSAAILAHDWTLLDRLLDVLHSPYILVRTDLDTSLDGRDVESGEALVAALETDPGVRVVRAAGALRLYRHDSSATVLSETAALATVESHNPDLRVLARLPQGTRLVEGPPRAGVPLVVPVPPVTSWTVSSNSLSVALTAPAGWSYRLVSIDATGHVVDGTPVSTGPPPAAAGPAGTGRQTGPGRDVRPPVTPATPVATGATGGLTVTTQDSAAGPTTRLEMATTGNLVGGDGFVAGTDEPGNCYNHLGAGAGRGLHATALTDAPGGGAGTRLRATADSACLQRPLVASGGPLLVSMDVRNVEGSVPRVCLWEERP
ncbi:MAG: arabinofuranan 3-O-arabinosyltransferase, partial [Chloroflexota bacterium]|nr:arabinofuranan 3-O-arabinosyltransferase [Chloroflexota bacterium]